MMTICASDIDHLIIVYEHVGGSGGGKTHMLMGSASKYVERDKTPPKSSQTWVHAIIELQLEEAIRYVSIGKFSCAF